MTDTVRLRHLAEVNPQTVEFDRLDNAANVTFMPLEAVWADERLDLTRVRPKGEVATGYVRFTSGDILCPKVTPTFQAGRAAIILKMPLSAGAASTEVHVVRARRGIADPRFLRYLLLTKSFLDEGVSRFQGVAGLQRVPDEFLRDLPVAMLAMNEQRRIADFLDDQVARIDNIITARQQQIDLIADKLQSDLAVRVDRLNQQGPTTSLGRFFNYIEQGSSPDADAIQAMSGEFGVLKTSAIKAGLFIAAENKLLPANAKWESRFEIRDHDVLVVRGSGSADLVADAAEVSLEAGGPRLMLSDLTYRLVGLTLRPSFAVALLLSLPLRAQIRAAVRQGSGPAKARGEDISSLRIPVVGPDDQQSFADWYWRQRADVESCIRVLNQSAECLQELKRSLITAAVTGEFDVSSSDGSRVPV